MRFVLIKFKEAIKQYTPLSLSLYTQRFIRILYIYIIFCVGHSIEY